MPLLPATLPVWAYLAAGGAAFAASKLASGATDPGAGPAAPAASGAGGSGGAGGSAAPIAGGGGDLWGAWGDQSAQFGPGGSIGFLPGITPPGQGAGLSDSLGGQPINVVVTDPWGEPIDFPTYPMPAPPQTYPAPAPAPTSSPGPAPAPTSSPAPSPTAAPAPAAPWYPAGMGTPPSNATGAIVAAAGTYRWYTVSGGKITGFKTVAVKAFSAFTNAYDRYPWPAQNSQRILVRILTGGHAGLFFSPAQTGVTYYPRR